MRKLRISLFAVFMLGVLNSYGNNVAKSLTVDDLVSWKRITQQRISNDGKWVACKMEPWRGDASVYLYDSKGRELRSFHAVDNFQFAASSSYLLVSQKPDLATIEMLKVKKTKKEAMPMNKLLLLKLQGDSTLLDSVRNYQLAEKADWLAYQRGRKDSTLFVTSLNAKHLHTYHAVLAYGFAKEGSYLYYVAQTQKSQALYVVNLVDGKSALVKEGVGEFSMITFNREGDKLAFLFTPEKKYAYKNTELWLSEAQQPAKRIVVSGDGLLQDNWVVSHYGKLYFSKSSARLFFGTSPEPRQQDTLTLAENRPKVQVWSWNEPVQYTVQQHNKEKDLKKYYDAVYQLSSGKILQLSTPEQPELMLAKEGDASWAVTYTSRPYSLSWMWEGRTRSDYYTVSLENGERKLLSKADYGEYSMSPDGKYAYGYVATDSCWYTISLADGIKHKLTTPQTFVAWDEENDVPDYPEAYGCAGWEDEDAAIYIYDRYDMWKFDPLALKKPVNLTINGRMNHISYRLLRLDKEKRSINQADLQVLKGTNTVTKGDGYYSLRFKKAAVPTQLMAGNYMLRTIQKAKNADKVIFTKETFETYPDVHYCAMNFKKPVQLTSGYKQQEGVRWGTAELVSWTSLDGVKLEGLLYKPADFDPNKKYPMIVNFYERNSDKLYNYRMPEAHRSTVDYHMYISNGYLLFNPDIRYRDGHPGESCYNCLIPGVKMLIDKGFVDEKAIAAQGHSWGGFQVAYLATRTDMFAAIESGAPVVNMFSAYGGIRWGSGLARAFQYEHTQSRLGTTLWEKPEIYQENSPLFTMDKVNTPILIMHNDNDGHVPWYQGIEYFVAMKRLGKPCWMLNYTGEIHWPMRLANRIDFQKRMQQFFNHYLKKEPMPKWMKDGLPAVDEPFELGY